MSKTNRAKKNLLLALAVLFGFGVSHSFATIRYVPLVYPTIQDAIDASMNGDAVELADGIYAGDGNKNLSYEGKAIRLYSASGNPELCVIDCEDEGRGFLFVSGEGSDSILEGITIRNGFIATDDPVSPFGGGLYCNEADPTILNCVVRDCQTTGSNSFGGGLYFGDSDSTISTLTIINNQADGFGGGLCARGSSMTIDGCTLSNNHSERSGGGIYLTGDNTVVDCHITENTGESGGGLSFSNGDIYLSRTVIEGNNAYRNAGGVRLYSGNALIENCLFYENHCGLVGGGGESFHCSPLFVNCTFTRNKARRYSGAFNASSESQALFLNCILWDDVPDEILSDHYGSSVSARYCNVLGGFEGVGNINTDPHFADALDCHITNESPCIDVGSNAPAGELSLFDLDGTPRLFDGDGDSVVTADMGAYEYRPTAPLISVPEFPREVIVREGSNPDDQVMIIRNGGGGTLNWMIQEVPSWMTLSALSGSSSGEPHSVVMSFDTSGLSAGHYSAILEVHSAGVLNSPRELKLELYVTTVLRVPVDYPTIQEGINAAIKGDVVEIADGVYTGAGNKNLDFKGKAITVRSKSGDPDSCVIDCESDGRGVIFQSYEEHDSVLDGIRITNGYMDFWGGGAYCTGSSPTFRRCVFDNNQAGDGYSAGGVYCNYSNALFDECEIINNSSDNRAGGLYCLDSNPILNHCLIAFNTAAKDGGGLAATFSTLVLTDCSILGNDAGRNGGGLFLSYSCDVELIRSRVSENSAMGAGIYCDRSTLSLSNCLVTRNQSGNMGGGLYVTKSNPVLTNCTVADNSARTEGGAIYCKEESNPVIRNCILRDDLPEEFSLEDAENSLSIRYCNVDGGWPGEGNIDSDPQYTSSSSQYFIIENSPCVDAGTNSMADSSSETDFGGGPRLLDGDDDSIATLDIGAYEYNPTQPYLVLSQEHLQFVSIEGNDPDASTIEIRNGGGGILEWGISGIPSWLNLSASSGTSSGEINSVILQADVSSLSHGEYTAELIIEPVEAVNEPLVLYITLFVTQTLYVPEEYPTIQAAIDASVDGDIVEIADGTYTGIGNKNIDFGGKAITVKSSSNDPKLCIIDCEKSGRGFIFQKGEEADSVLSGLSIINGTPVNPSDLSGGGIYCKNSSPTITHCRIYGCVLDTASYAYGAGVCCSGSSSTFSDCIFSHNVAIGVQSAVGGGVCCGGGTPKFINCSFENNRANSGGGLSVGNVDEALLKNCTFIGNLGKEEGGGLRLSSEGDYSLVNCVFRKNVALEGGALSGGGTTTTLLHCTVTMNISLNSVGAVRLSGTEAQILNSILWNNEPYSLSLLSSDNTVRYCSIDGDWPGEGNMDRDPKFMSPGDLRLRSDSPCIDAGTNGILNESYPEDVEGRLRPLDGSGDSLAIVDMGAYEFDSSAHPVAVSTSSLYFHEGAGKNQSRSQVILLEAFCSEPVHWEIETDADWLLVDSSQGEVGTNGSELRVSVCTSALVPGMYKANLAIFLEEEEVPFRIIPVTLRVGHLLCVPSGYPTIQSALDDTDEGDVVELADGIYTGEGNRDLVYRDHSVILRSKSGVPEKCIIDCEHFSRGIYHLTYRKPPCTLEGITIRNGYASGSVPEDKKGGALYSTGPITVRNCILENNRADDIGGGIYIKHERFTYGDWTCIENCRIRNNRAKYYGGGIACQGKGVAINQCLISGNCAEEEGGAIYHYDGATSYLTNCTIVDNYAQAGSGIVCDSVSHSRPGEVNCTNCILRNGFDQFLNYDESILDITYCDVQGGWEGVGNRQTDPSFAFANDYHLLTGSALIDAGTNSVSNLYTHDIDSTRRILDGDGDLLRMVDIGAYENNPGPRIALNQTFFSFSVAVGETSRTPEVLSVRNSGYGTLQWSLSGQPSWLTCSTTSGESSGEINTIVLNVGATELPVGTYTSIFEVEDTQSGETRFVEVVAKVGNILDVPASYPTILSAIEASTNGDVIELADGIYSGDGNINLNFSGKAITVRSASNNPDSCIIDCNGRGMGFVFRSSEGRDSIIEALTICNGHYYFEYSGGGIYCLGSHPTINRCNILENDESQGGGIHCKQSSPLIRNCVISNNTSVYGGGGIGCEMVSCPIIIDTQFCNNQSTYASGVLSCRYGSYPSLIRCSLTGNNGSGGGAISCRSGSSAYLVDCILSGNRASTSGGVFNAWSDGNAVMDNCLISGNSADEEAAVAICRQSSKLVMKHCTIADNHSSDGVSIVCGFVDNELPNDVRISNSIFWDEQELISNHDGSLVEMMYCDARYGAGAPWFGIGCIDADPLFMDAEGIDNDPTTWEDNEYRIGPGSPCIDLVAHRVPGYPVEYDLDGTLRPLDGDYDLEATSDAGAYEYDPDRPALIIDHDVFEFVSFDGATPAPQMMTIRNGGGGSAMEWTLSGVPDWLHVDPLSGELLEGTADVSLSLKLTHLPNGFHSAVLEVIAPGALSSPRKVTVSATIDRAFIVPDYYPTIQAAIDDAGTGDTVLVQDGVYSGEGNKNLDFYGKGITLRSVSGDPSRCILDCEGDGRGFYFHTGETSDAVVQGITVINGDEAYGGGVYCINEAAPLFVNCILSGNHATRGGGVCCDDADPVFQDCVFTANSVSEHGGACACTYEGTLLLIDCQIENNLALSGVGGGICGISGDLIIVNSRVSENTAGYSGGGLYVNNSTLVLDNSALFGNRVNSGSGGAIITYNSTLAITQASIVDNDAASGAGIACDSVMHPRPSTVTIVNSLLWNGNDQIWNDDGSAIEASYSDLQGGTGESWFGVGCIDVDPQFVDPDGLDDDPATIADNDYRIGLGSPCIDAGDNDAVSSDLYDLDHDEDITELLPVDLGGNPRFLDDANTEDTGNGVSPIIDMGAYEYFIGQLAGDLDDDGDVDLDDFSEFVDCLTGPSVPGGGGSELPSQCSQADLDLDGDVDLQDYSRFQLVFE